MNTNMYNTMQCRKKKYRDKLFEVFLWNLFYILQNKIIDNLFDVFYTITCWTCLYVLTALCFKLIKIHFGSRFHPNSTSLLLMYKV